MVISAYNNIAELGVKKVVFKFRLLKFHTNPIRQIFLPMTFSCARNSNIRFTTKNKLIPAVETNAQKKLEVMPLENDI